MVIFMKRTNRRLSILSGNLVTNVVTNRSKAAQIQAKLLLHIVYKDIADTIYGVCGLLVKIIGLEPHLKSTTYSVIK